MKVVPLSPQLEHEYNRFVTSQPDALLYHSLKYRDFLVRLTGARENYLLAMSDGLIHGVLPLMIQQHSGQSVVNSLPFYGSHGGILSPSPEARSLLTECYNELAVESGTIAATIVENPFAPAIDDNFRHNLVDTRISQWTNLVSSTIETILTTLDGSTRRNIRKASRQGFEILQEPSQLDALEAIHLANMEAIGGKPKDHLFFESIPDIFQEHQDFDLFIVRKDHKIAAALLVFYFGRTVEYFTPAVDQEFRSEQPLALAIVSAMAAAWARGYRIWNWGGTWLSQTGVYRFKRKWGAEERTYKYYCQLNDESLLNSAPAELLMRFPNFYVLPFSALQRRSA